MRKALHSYAALSVVAAVLLGLTGCGAAKSPSEASRKPVVQVVERDFHIKAPERVPAGDVRISVHNKGPDDHELILVKDRESELPFRSDGLTIDEDKLGSNELGALEPGEPGTVRELKVHLAPGRYELLCNMAGHYLGGMEREFTVG